MISHHTPTHPHTLVSGDNHLLLQELHYFRRRIGTRIHEAEGGGWVVGGSPNIDSPLCRILNPTILGCSRQRKMEKSATS